MFDAYPEIGGLLTYGIPPFKLEKQVVRQRREILEGMGVQFVLNTRIGEDKPFEELLDEFDAVFLGMGTYEYVRAAFRARTCRAFTMRCPTWLATYTVSSDTTKRMRRTSILQGKNVVVLGGGDTGMDCNRTAIRQGAASVTCALPP